MALAILVTGATGKQGGAVIDALLSQNAESFIILAVTRDVSRPAARKLGSRSPSIKLVQGDLDEVPVLLKEAQRVAEQPIWGVYSVQISMGKGVTSEGEIRQGKSLIDESIKAGVKHFVYSSVERGGDNASWDNPTPIPHFQTKYEIEHHLRNATAPGRAGENMGWTILRPVAKWDRKAVGLAGDELNVDMMSHAFMNVTGQPAPMAYSFLGSVLTFMVSEMRVMISWFASDGYRADIQARRADHPGLLTFVEWLDQESPFENAEW
ncbi:hypothetical protein EKO27_g8855 [Xylaria grammica]|uniref:NmrA-like domain-containing protein n=1 Tax=Xylaria grammica TaxID=363999 RepID=A0A439CW48_9PEZI|nr:hypothetical protein EKO27_g8855 [Xylaria grammica]